MSQSGLSLSLLEASQLRVLEPARLSFTWQETHLRLTIADHASWSRASVLRCFPLKKPRSHYSVRDRAQKEIGVILDPTSLDAVSQRAIECDLQRRYLITTIERIHAVHDRFGVLEWEIVTSRGDIAMVTRDIRDHVIRATPTHWILSDVEGRRYEIADVRLLDARSASLVHLHL